MAAGVTLVEISTASASHTYAKAADARVQGVEVRSNAPQTVSIGTTPGGDELAGPQALDADQVWTLKSLPVPSFDAADIYFSGLTGNNDLKLWLLTA